MARLPCGYTCVEKCTTRHDDGSVSVEFELRIARWKLILLTVQMARKQHAPPWWIALILVPHVALRGAG